MGVSAAAGGGATAPPAPPSPESTPSPSVPTTDELVRAVAQAQGAIAAALADGHLARDPYRFVLAGLSDTLGVLLKTTRRWENATAAVVAAQHPLSAEERAGLVREVVAAAADGTHRAARKEMAGLERAYHRERATRAGLAVAGAFAAGIAATFGGLWAAGMADVGPFGRRAQGAAAWAEVAENNPDPRPALAAAGVKADAAGRRYYSGVSLWLDPPRAPPAADKR